MSRTHKVLVPPGFLAAQGDGVQLLYDYGAYALYRISYAALLELTPQTRAQVRLVDEMDQILIAAYPFNTQTDVLSLPTPLRTDSPTGSALQLVQFVGPIRDEWLEAVAKAGVVPIHYIANNAYLVWTDDRGRSTLDTMAKRADVVQYSIPYHPFFKLGPSILDRVREQRNADELVPVEIQMYDHPGKGTTQDILHALTIEQLAPWQPILAYQNTVARVRAGDLEAIASLPDVVWVGEHWEPKLLDEVQGQILAGNMDASQTGPSGPGYLAWLDSYGFSTSPADYPIVDIVDDGIGNGTVNSGDYTLYQLGQVSNPTRLSYVANCTAAADGRGIGGHGHINASIAGSYDTNAGVPYRDGDGFQRGLGINPYGWLAGTRVFGPGFSLTRCGGTDVGLIRSIQDHGAQIASNSWGCAECAGTYNASSQAFDVGVRDADLTEPGNQELTFVFAAGNEGPAGGTVNTPGNAKNVITIGASENDRPTWTDGCGIGPGGADNAMDIIGFSSRGPVPGNRVKPELVAPGTHIQGTASTDPGYSGSGVCDPYYPTAQTIFASSSGTSHSTPAIAGVASLYYYWLQTRYGVAPSPALIKAYMIAHTTYLTGLGAGDTLPSNSQGYGMPNMSLAFDNTPRHIVNQSHRFDNSGETWIWGGAVADPSKPVRIALAYTDQAGAIGVSPQVNDLDLAVNVGGVAYLGNVFSGQWSTMGGSPDPANNYEAVSLPPGTTGSISITVTALNIAGDGVPNIGDTTDQDFALVCYNCTQAPDFTLSATPGFQRVCAPGDAAYSVSLGQISTFTYPVALSTTGEPTGTTTSFSQNPVIPPGTSVLTVSHTEAAAAGSYSFAVVGIAPTSSHTTTVGLQLFTAVPGSVSLITPADGATGVDTSPTMQWVTATQAVSYYLEVATDPGFSTLAYSATVTQPMHTVARPLSFSTGYYWRVTAQNTCGNGIASAALQFVTQDEPFVFCRAPNVSIPDNNPTGVTDSLTIGQNGSILDLNVTISATHTWVGDLVFTLEHMDTGTRAILIDRPGHPQDYLGCKGDDIQATLDDQATSPVEDQCSATPPAISGSFLPNEPLSRFNGEVLSGTWSLTVSDLASIDRGTLMQWCLEPVSSTIVTEPQIRVEPASLSNTQSIDIRTAAALTITNAGDADLTWSIQEGTACGAPSDISWLSVSPISGTTVPTTYTTVDASFDSHGMAAGTYTGTLCVSSNDPVTPLLPIPITLTVRAPIYLPLITRSHVPALPLTVQPRDLVRVGVQVMVSSQRRVSSN